MKNSNCKITTLYSILSTGWEESYDKITEALKAKIRALWLNDDFFTNYFVQNGISLWQTLKPKFQE